MAIYAAYYLNFRSALHLGRRGIGLEETETHVPADTLFSALCQTWRTFYGSESLTRDFLDAYDDQSVPLMLTSAFPYADQVRFYPKPSWIDFDEQVTVDDTNRKQLKKVRFLSEVRFKQLLSGQKLLFGQEEMVNHGTSWVSAAEKEQLSSNPGQNQSSDISIWNVEIRPRVTLDRTTSNSAIWHLANVKFNRKCGLWFAARYQDQQVQSKVETLLRVLGDTGIGGERNAGCGLFDMEVKSFDLEMEPIEGKRFVSLSPVCPRDSHELAELLDDERIGYAFHKREGWISSLDGGHLRRDRIWMFAEGSVLCANAKQVGGLVNLQPPGCPHPVWRYGYAWQVGME